jgi:hypothetical protein
MLSKLFLIEINSKVDNCQNPTSEFCSYRPFDSDLLLFAPVLWAVS